MPIIGKFFLRRNLFAPNFIIFLRGDFMAMRETGS